MNRPTPQIALETKMFSIAHPTLLVVAFTLCAITAAAQSSPAAQIKPATHPTRRIVVSFTDRKLALLEGDRVIKVYDVAVGATVSPSPSGEYQIVQRLENPAYYKPGVVIGPGTQNPLGPRWIGLSVKGFGIHGTNRPDSIGKSASHGCIRLRNEDIKDLFARVQVGDHVSLVGERTDEVARLFGPAPSIAEAHETLQASNEAPVASEAHGDR
ncbi:MAG: L,D-transpeptidase [Candidatus Acidiferrum sp.]